MWPFVLRKNKRRILCIGDSITYGSGIPFWQRKQTFPAILERMLGKEFQVLNYGIPGVTMSPMSDKPYSKTFFDSARRTAPEVCLLMLGTNDSKPQNWNAALYEEAVAHWIEALTKLSSKPQLYLMTPPAAFSVNGEAVVYAINKDIIRDEVYPIVKNQAQRYHVRLIDLYAKTKDHPELFTDGVHPNVQGNQEIAKAVFEELEKV